MPLTCRGLQPVRVEQHEEEQVYRALPPKVPEFVYVVGPAPKPLGQPRPADSVDKREKQQFLYHPRHIGRNAVTKYKMVRQQARKVAGCKITKLRAQYQRLARSGRLMSLELQIQFAQTLVKKNLMAQPIIVYIPVVNYMDGINHTRILVDTREKALSMASFKMFKNKNVRRFVQTPTCTICLRWP